MFERDKDELRAAGIPIETRTFRDAEGNDAVSGYHLSSRNFYLPYVRLLPVQPLLLIFTS
jgi:predicted DNA-binding transcriptional regulator YafY